MASPTGEWEKTELREGLSLDPTWTAERDAAFSGLGYLPSSPDPHRIHYLDGNVALLRPRGVYGLHGLSGAALLPTGSSLECAAGCPGDCDRRGEMPTRDYSVAGSSRLLRWRSLSSHYQPRYRRYSHRRSGRNERSRSGTATESWGGPWPGTERV